MIHSCDQLPRTSDKRVPQNVPAAEVGQRTRLSGLDRPQHDRQPLSWGAQNKGLQIPRRDQGDDNVINFIPRRSALL